MLKSEYGISVLHCSNINHFYEKYFYIIKEYLYLFTKLDKIENLKISKLCWLYK